MSSKSNSTDILYDALHPWRICGQCLGIWPGWKTHLKARNKYTCISFLAHLFLIVDIMVFTCKTYLEFGMDIFQPKRLYVVSYTGGARLMTFFIIIHTWKKFAKYLDYLNKWQCIDISLAKYSKGIWWFSWCSNVTSIGVATLGSAVGVMISLDLIKRMKSNSPVFLSFYILRPIVTFFELFGLLFFNSICFIFYKILYYGFVEFSSTLANVLNRSEDEGMNGCQLPITCEVLCLFRQKYERLVSLANELNELFSPLLLTIIVTQTYILCSVLYQAALGVPQSFHPYLIWFQIIGIITRFLIFLMLCTTANTVHDEVRWKAEFLKLIA